MKTIFDPETHLNSRNFIRNLGRDWTGHFVAGDGRSGGLLAVWKSSRFRLFTAVTKRCISLFLIAIRLPGLLLLFMALTLKESVTPFGISLETSTVFAWLLVVDFNVILNSFDKKSGGKRFDDNLAVCTFNDFVFRQGLLDLGYVGLYLLQ